MSALLTKGQRVRSEQGQARRRPGAKERSLVFCPITCNTGCDFFLVSGEWRRGGGDDPGAGAKKIA